VHGVGSDFAADLELGAAGGQVHVAGDVQLGGGDLTVTAGSIAVDHAVVTDGGSVDLNAEQVAISSTGRLQAEGGSVGIQASEIDHRGSISVGSGTAVLNAGEAGTLRVAGTVNAVGAQSGETGGTIHLLGDRVELVDQARVDAS